MGIPLNSGHLEAFFRRDLPGQPSTFPRLVAGDEQNEHRLRRWIGERKKMPYDETVGRLFHGDRSWRFAWRTLFPLCR